MSNIEKAKLIIKLFYKHADCGIYNTQNIMGDTTETVYIGEGLRIDVCYYYSYFEVFGLSDEEFKELKNYYKSLDKSEESK